MNKCGGGHCGKLHRGPALFHRGPWITTKGALCEVGRLRCAGWNAKCGESAVCVYTKLLYNMGTHPRRVIPAVEEKFFRARRSELPDS